MNIQNFISCISLAFDDINPSKEAQQQICNFALDCPISFLNMISSVFSDPKSSCKLVSLCLVIADNIFKLQEVKEKELQLISSNYEYLVTFTQNLPTFFQNDNEMIRNCASKSFSSFISHLLSFNNFSDEENVQNLEKQKIEILQFCLSLLDQSLNSISLISTLNSLDFIFQDNFLPEDISFAFFTKVFKILSSNISLYTINIKSQCIKILDHFSSYFHIFLNEEIISQLISIINENASEHNFINSAFPTLTSIFNNFPLYLPYLHNFLPISLEYMNSLDDPNNLIWPLGFWAVLINNSDYEDESFALREYFKETLKQLSVVQFFIFLSSKIFNYEIFNGYQGDEWIPKTIIYEILLSMAIKYTNETLPIYEFFFKENLNDQNEGKRLSSYFCMYSLLTVSPNSYNNDQYFEIITHSLADDSIHIIGMGFLILSLLNNYSQNTEIDFKLLIPFSSRIFEVVSIPKFNQDPNLLGMAIEGFNSINLLAQEQLFLNYFILILNSIIDMLVQTDPWNNKFISFLIDCYSISSNCFLNIQELPTENKRNNILFWKAKFLTLKQFIETNIDIFIKSEVLSSFCIFIQQMISIQNGLLFYDNFSNLINMCFNLISNGPSDELSLLSCFNSLIPFFKEENVFMHFYKLYISKINNSTETSILSCLLYGLSAFYSNSIIRSQRENCPFSTIPIFDLIFRIIRSNVSTSLSYQAIHLLPSFFLIPKEYSQFVPQIIDLLNHFAPLLPQLWENEDCVILYIGLMYISCYLMKFDENASTLLSKECSFLFAFGSMLEKNEDPMYSQISPALSLLHEFFTN